MKTQLSMERRKGGDLRAVAAVVAIGFLLAGCKTAQVKGERELTVMPLAKPAVICVADFEVWAQIQHEEGVLSGQSGPLGRVGERLYGTSADPAARARQLVELMSTSLQKSLTKQGLTASRLLPGMPLPADGWLVRGIFTHVQEGNRLKRAMIGFGKGQTDIQVITSIHNLAQGTPQPLYQIETEASSGSTPGAAPTLVLGPYGAAARFVMAGGDLDKNVKQTAAQIAETVRKRVEAAH